MKASYLILIVLILLTAGCSKNEPAPYDALEETGLLDRWEIQKTIVDGIADLSAECCTFIEFNKDSHPDDLKGDFRSYGVGYETNGIFEVNTVNLTILFDYNNKQRSYGFDIEENLLALSYEDEGRQVMETWVRVEE
jgi:hypothetical protein